MTNMRALKQDIERLEESENNYKEEIERLLAEREQHEKKVSRLYDEIKFTKLSVDQQRSNFSGISPLLAPSHLNSEGP